MIYYTTMHLFPLCASYILFLSRGMKFENVQILTDAISDIISDMKWAWWVSFQYFVILLHNMKSCLSPIRHCLFSNPVYNWLLKWESYEWVHPQMIASSSVRVDQAGVICKQEGIFRVNCMDCLDRTNVVQAAIARVVMEQQVRAVSCLDPSSCRNLNALA